MKNIDLERELRRRPTGLVEGTEQDAYYDGASSLGFDLPPWTDDLDDHEDEL